MKALMRSPLGACAWAQWCFSGDHVGPVQSGRSRIESPTPHAGSESALGMEQLFCGRARSIVQQLFFAQIRVGLVAMETTVEIKMFVGKKKEKKKRTKKSGLDCIFRFYYRRLCKNTHTCIYTYAHDTRHGRTWRANVFEIGTLQLREYLTGSKSTRSASRSLNPMGNRKSSSGSGIQICLPHKSQSFIRLQWISDAFPFILYHARAYIYLTRFFLSCQHICKPMRRL